MVVNHGEYHESLKVNIVKPPVKQCLWRHSFNFSFVIESKTLTWLQNPDSASSWVFLRQDGPHITKACANISTNKLLSKEEMEKAFGEALATVPLPDRWRPKMAGIAWHEANQLLTAHRHFDRAKIDLEFHLILERRFSFSSLKKPQVSDCGTVTESCCICLEDYKDGCQVLHMPCGHGFHGDCLREWFRVGNCCPLCRYKMPTSL